MLNLATPSVAITEQHSTMDFSPYILHFKRKVNAILPELSSTSSNTLPQYISTNIGEMRLDDEIDGLHNTNGELDPQGLEKIIPMILPKLEAETLSLRKSRDLVIQYND